MSRPRALTGRRLVALVALALGMGVLGFFSTRGCASASSDAPVLPG